MPFGRTLRPWFTRSRALCCLLARKPVRQRRGLTVLFVVLIVYVLFGVVERARLEGINYLADTLIYWGAILLLAGAMPREASRRDPLSAQ